MDTKLTLNIDKSVIDEAKLYAKSQKISLSKLVETYLSSLTKESKNQDDVSPIVQSLTGIIPDSYDETSDYRSYITKKYE